MEVSKTMTIGEILDENPDAAGVLLGFGMHCFGCPMGRSETLEEAALVHGIEVDDIISKLKEL